MQGLIINDTQSAVTITLDKQIVDPEIIRKALKMLEIMIEPIIPKKRKKYLTGKELANSDVVGIWEDRGITDSVEYVNKLRRKIQRREI